MKKKKIQLLKKHLDWLDSLPNLEIFSLNLAYWISGEISFSNFLRMSPVLSAAQIGNGWATFTITRCTWLDLQWTNNRKTIQASQSSSRCNYKTACKCAKVTKCLRLSQKTVVKCPLKQVSLSSWLTRKFTSSSFLSVNSWANWITRYVWR